MKSLQVARVELLVNPFCLCERDFGCLTQMCRKHDLTFDTYNPWELDDEQLDGLPPYIANLVRERRSGQRAGSVYSDVFVNGERIPINEWPRSFDIIEGKIVAALTGARE